MQCWFKSTIQCIRDNNTVKYCLIGGVAVIGIYKTKKWIDKKKRREKWNSLSQGTVVLHMIPRGRTAPNMSPFPLKLETYLRMANIPYVVDFSEPLGPKGKTPWITLNGEDLSDSQLVMEYLGRKYDKDFSKDLTPEDRAAGRAFQIMLEEHFYWGLGLWRYIYDGARSIEKIQKFPCLVNYMFRTSVPKRVKRSAWSQGIGRHTEADVIDITLKDLRAVADYLGSKPYLLGSEPTEYDCSVFGLLALCVWCTPGSPYEKALDGELKTLKEYCLRMKERFWKDWDDCIDP